MSALDSLGGGGGAPTNAQRSSLVRTVFTATITVIAVVIGLYFVYLLRRPIGWLLIAGFVAVALSGPVAALSRYMRRGFAITIVMLAVLLVPIGVIAVVVPPLVSEASNLVEEIPQYANEFDHWINSNEKLREINDDYDITGRVQEWANRLPSRFGDAAQWLGDLGIGLVNSIFAAVTIFIMVAFMLGSGPRWVRRIIELQRREHAHHLSRTIDSMAQAVGAYVAGALVQAFVAGITTFIVLKILGVPFAAPLAVLTALFDLIPMVGATIGAVIVGIVTVFADFPIDTIIWVIWAIVYQQLENNIIQPRIQNKAVGIHPFGVIFAVLCGGTLLGVPGAILAVPVAASIQIAIRDFWNWRRAQQQSELVAPPGAGGFGGPGAPPAPPPSAGGPEPAGA